METDATKKTKIVVFSIKIDLKTTGTDSNSRFTGVRAELPRLQISVTWPKTVKYGISRYHFIKFWAKSRIRPEQDFGPKRLQNGYVQKKLEN